MLAATSWLWELKQLDNTTMVSAEGLSYLWLDVDGLCVGIYGSLEVLSFKRKIASKVGQSWQ